MSVAIFTTRGHNDRQSHGARRFVGSVEEGQGSGWGKVAVWEDLFMSVAQADTWRGARHPGRTGVRCRWRRRASEELGLQKCAAAGDTVGDIGRLLLRPRQSAGVGVLEGAEDERSAHLLIGALSTAP